MTRQSPEDRVALIATCLEQTVEPDEKARTSKPSIQQAVIARAHLASPDPWTPEDTKTLGDMITEIGGPAVWHAGMRCHALRLRSETEAEPKKMVDAEMPKSNEGAPAPNPPPNPIHELPPPTCPNVNQTSQDTIQVAKSPHGANGRPTATVLSRPVIRIRLDGLQLSDHETLALALLVQVGHTVSLDIQILLERFLAATQRHRGLDVEIPGDPVMEPDVVIEP